MIVQSLNQEGWAVQLKHVPQETSWDDEETHGFVTIKNASGSVLVTMPGLQHNRKLRALRDSSAIEKIKEAVGMPGNGKALSDDGSTLASETSKEAPSAA